MFDWSFSNFFLTYYLKEEQRFPDRTFDVGLKWAISCWAQPFVFEPTHSKMFFTRDIQQKDKLLWTRKAKLFLSKAARGIQSPFWDTWVTSKHLSAWPLHPIDHSYLLSRLLLGFFACPSLSANSALLWPNISKKLWLQPSQWSTQCRRVTRIWPTWHFWP